MLLLNRALGECVWEDQAEQRRDLHIFISSGNSPDQILSIQIGFLSNYQESS